MLSGLGCESSDRPVTQLIGAERLQAIMDRAKTGGGEIVKLMGTSAYYAPAAASIQMAEAIIKDKRRILPCVPLPRRGEYVPG